MNKYRHFVMFIAILLSMVVFSQLTGISTCMLYLFTGVPCPTCGLTRAWLSALRGDFQGAFRFHPLFLLVLLAPMPFVSIKGRVLSNNQKNVAFIILIGVFVVVWVVRLLSGIVAIAAII